MKTRSDLDLNEFEKLLNERVEQIEENLAQLRLELDSVGGDDGSNDPEDFASLQSLNTKDHTLMEQQENELKETIHALAKIKNGTYGICEKSAKAIPVERLKVNPIARTVVGVED